MRVKYPGKLYLMGEYAVMESYQSAVVCAVNRFLTVEIEEASEIRIESSYGVLTEEDIHCKEGPMAYVAVAVELAHELVLENTKKYHIKITSELEVQHVKYGFGSSGVVVVAILDAITKFYGKPLDPLVLFKLSVIAQARMQRLSSGGDLASTIYGGIIHYRRYDVTWFQKQELHKDLAYKVWPGLHIEKMPLHHFDISVGWTQKPNSTDQFLNLYQKSISQDPMTHRALLVSANSIVSSFVEAWLADDTDQVFKDLKHYRSWMLKLANWADINIETESLSRLIEIAESYDMAAKVSGSGGGDCGIALSSLKNRDNSEKCHKEWLKNDIVYMDIEVFEHE